MYCIYASVRKQNSLLPDYCSPNPNPNPDLNKAISFLLKIQERLDTCLHVINVMYSILNLVV